MEAAERTRLRTWWRAEARKALTVAIGREQLLRKRLLRGDGPHAVLAQVDAMDGALAQLWQALDGLDAANQGDPPV